MKNIFKIVCFVGLVAIVSTSCKKVLDKRDLTGLQDDLVFSDSLLARTYIDYIYGQNLPQWGGTNGLNANLSDESYGASKYFEGTLGVSDVTDFGTALANNNNYARIRTINTFLKEIDKGTLSESYKKTLKGQALFFRAWRYFELVKIYGGVPLVLDPLDAVGDANKADAFKPRNKTSECILQMAKDLDLAVSYLPGKYMESSDWGRVTSGAAAALKGRVLQLWASPLFNPSDLADRWQAAYEASVQAKTILSANGFGLHPNYETMWFTELNNPEAVFITGYNSLTADQTKKNNGYDNSTRPAFAGTGGGANQPSREMIDAYPMKDGLAKGNSTTYPYDPQIFYKNRDPRFDKTIAYNGTTWKLNGTTYPKLWFYFSSGSSFAPYTVNTTGTAPTNTGFFLRKAINPDLGVSAVVNAGTDWMEIRYAEVLLNLAEAACGTSKLDEAYEELKAIRARAGIVPGADGLYGLQAGMSRDQMFAAILLERQLELAFEGKRYWDMRRWKLFETVVNGKKRTGTTYTFKSSPAIANHAAFLIQRELIPLDSAYTNNFTIASKTMDSYNANWKPEYYFLPIPQAAINNNPSLLQNTGWTGGTFDPLQ